MLLLNQTTIHLLYGNLIKNGTKGLRSSKCQPQKKKLNVVYEIPLNVKAISRSYHWIEQ